MKFLMKVSMSTEGGNRAVLSGSLGSTMQSILADIKPESVYFTAEGGRRTGYLIININDPSEIPGISEPFFLSFDAEVAFYPAMSPQDLANAGPGIERAAKKYGK